MNKIIGFLFFIMCVVSCVKDTSVYAPQEKEKVDAGKLFNPDLPEQLSDSLFRPGIHKISLRVGVTPDDTMVREFKYYLPASLNISKTVSLIFNFHGSISYDAGSTAPDPILNISPSHVLNRLADTTNIIIVWPAGTGEGTAVNWASEEKHLPFVSAMLKFFEKPEFAIDFNRVYACGVSSGAIFNFVLARSMSDKFAAVCPVSGQMKLENMGPLGTRVCHIRAFNGVNDLTVNHGAAFSNIQSWADIMAGYYVKDSIKGQTPISSGNYTVKPTKWDNGNGDIEFFSIPEADHSVNWANIITQMWTFMAGHPLHKTSGMYIGLEKDVLKYTAGKTVEVPFRISNGVTARVVSYPSGFTVGVVGNVLRIVAGKEAINGSIVLEGSLNGIAKTVDLNLTK